MKPLLSLVLLPLWPLIQVRRLLQLQLRLRWQGRRPRFVLEEPSQSPPPPPVAPRPRKSRKAAPASSSEPGSKAPAEADSDMHRELQALLTQHHKTRQLMRHLAYIERHLKLAGPDGLDALPLDVLKKASVQLEELVSDWSSAGLAELRLRLTMLVSDKEDATHNNFVPTNSALSDFNAKRVQVSDASESVFAAAERSWLGRMPPSQDKQTTGD